MDKLTNYKAQLVGIQKKICNLQKIEFSLQQKIEKLEKYPEYNTELNKVSSEEKVEP